MYTETLSKEQLAITYTHYVYRNTIVEDYHSKCITMDNNFYKKIHRLVATKITYLLKFIEIEKQITVPEDLVTVGSKFDPTTGREFLRFFGEHVFHMGSDWDTPVEYSKTTITNRADYILEGCFTECCNSSSMLDDKTMHYINKDICNRIYTLMQNGLL